MSCRLMSSRLAGAREVTSRILSRHFWIVATFARTTSLSGIELSPQDLFFRFFAEVLEVGVFVEGPCEEFLVSTFFPVEHFAGLQGLHSDHRPGEVQRYEVDFFFQQEGEGLPEIGYFVAPRGGVEQNGHVDIAVPPGGAFRVGTHEEGKPGILFGMEIFTEGVLDGVVQTGFLHVSSQYIGIIGP